MAASPARTSATRAGGAGIGGARSGLWSEYARLIGELRPRFVIVENVSALLARGLDVVLGDLAEIGYDAEWHCISAAAIGAPHERDRLWIVAYPSEDRMGENHDQYREDFARHAGNCTRTDGKDALGCGNWFRWERYRVGSRRQMLAR